jgi:hypothetical protein
MTVATCKRLALQAISIALQSTKARTIRTRRAPPPLEELENVHKYASRL